MYDAADVKQSLETENLSNALLKLEIYCKYSGFNEVADWANNERIGYVGVSTNAPSYLDYWNLRLETSFGVDSSMIYTC